MRAKPPHHSAPNSSAHETNDPPSQSHAIPRGSPATSRAASLASNPLACRASPAKKASEFSLFRGALRPSYSAYWADAAEIQKIPIHAPLPTAPATRPVNSSCPRTIYLPPATANPQRPSQPHARPQPQSQSQPTANPALAAAAPCTETDSERSPRPPRPIRAPASPKMDASSPHRLQAPTPATALPPPAVGESRKHH